MSTNTTHITVFSFAVYFVVFHIPLLISFHEKDFVIIKFERPLSWLISNLERVPIARVHGRDWGYFFRLLLDRQRSSFFPATRGERKSESVQINGKKEERWARREEIFSSLGLPPSFVALHTQSDVLSISVTRSLASSALDSHPHGQLHSP